MNTWAALLTLLVCALSSTALTTPNFRVRQASDSGSSTMCSSGKESRLEATSSFMVPNGTLRLDKYSCVAPTNTALSPVAANECSEDDGVWGWLDGILWWFFPNPDCSKPKPKPTTSVKTVTKATTTTRTDTVTSVSVSVSATTETATATTTATDLTTVVESTTAVVTVTSTASGAAPSSTATDVCGALCTNVCNEFGQLPPTTDDCQQLVNSINILNGQISKYPDFTVDPDHVQTITFGTCRFFFENLGPQPLTYCWLALTQVASAAASECLPPTQPVNSEGLCIARDSTWEVGVAHS